MSYNTKQKQLILDLIKSTENTQFTTSDIIEKLKEAGASVGTATVYRYLDSLTERGVIKKFFVSESTGAYYQYTDCSGYPPDHVHLKCTQCGCIIHLDCHLINKLNTHIFDKHNFFIDNAKTILYGLCNKCKGV